MFYQTQYHPNGHDQVLHFPVSSASPTQSSPVLYCLSLTPGPPGLPLPVNPVTAEMVLRGSLTIRTLCTPRLQSAGVEIILAGAVQTLCGVHGGGGTRGTADTSSPVVRVTDTIQEVAGDTSETLCAGPGTLRTFETALGVGVEDVVRQTAVQALAGVGRAWP